MQINKTRLLSSIMSTELSKDTVSEADIPDTTTPASSSASSNPARPNAFTALMAPKRKATPASELSTSKRTQQFFGGKDGLGAYIQSPEKYGASRVIYYNEGFVAINDLYPKASVHCLLLPRSEKHVLLHPFDAFEDAEFLASVQAEAKKLKALVAKELRRKYGPCSKQDTAREAVLNGEVEAEGLPEGRNWEEDVRVGIHAHPSMNHLHIHVLSVDRYSECLKHRKHYNSFATPFFVDLEDFPLAQNDVRRHPGREGYLQSDMKCWRCGMNFGNRFARLKDHLAEEFEEWKKE